MPALRGETVLEMKASMVVHLHHDDLPCDLDFGDSVAIDTETMGLNPHRDRLCVVQLSAGDGNAHLVKFSQSKKPCPNLEQLLTDQVITKLFHFARFDIAVLNHHITQIGGPIYCTKIASKLCRTYTDRHGLRDLCRELLGIEISKQQQSSDWGADELTEEQQAYAAGDVLYLHRIRAKLDTMLVRENRDSLAADCFAFLRTRTQLDLDGFADTDIFHH